MGSPTTQTATQTNTPWSGAVPAITDIINQAGTLYNGSAGTVSPSSPYTAAGLSALGGLGAQGSPNLASGNAAAQQLLTGTGTAGNALTATARGDGLQTANPHLEGQIQDQSDQIATQLRSLYSGSGRYGSSTMNRDLTDRLGQLRGGILSTNWENERNRQLQAAGALQAGQVSGLGSLSGLDDLRYSGANQLLQAGNIADTINQSKNDNPWTRLQNYGNTVAGVTSGTGTQTSSQPGPSVLSQILGGTAGVGSLIGSLAKAGILSDERTKTDVRRVGETDGGLGIFTYRFKHEGKAAPIRMGVMAGEVAHKQPDAALSLPMGLRGVDYARVA